MGSSKDRIRPYLPANQRAAAATNPLTTVHFCLVFTLSHWSKGGWLVCLPMQVMANAPVEVPVLESSDNQNTVSYHPKGAINKQEVEKLAVGIGYMLLQRNAGQGGIEEITVVNTCWQSQVAINGSGCENARARTQLLWLPLTGARCKEATNP